MADHSSPTVAGITLDSEAKLEPDAIGAAQDTIGMTSSAPAATVALTF